MVRSTYDPEADAAYFYLSDAQSHESEEVAPDVTLDFDKEGRVTGMEVLHAKSRLAPGPWSEALIQDFKEAASDH